jgi:hypothetical protein
VARKQKEVADATEKLGALAQNFVVTLVADRAVFDAWYDYNFLVMPLVNSIASGHANLADRIQLAKAQRASEDRNYDANLRALDPSFPAPTAPVGPRIIR